MPISRQLHTPQTVQAQSLSKTSKYTRTCGGSLGPSGDIRGLGVGSRPVLALWEPGHLHALTAPSFPALSSAGLLRLADAAVPKEVQEQGLDCLGLGAAGFVCISSNRLCFGWYTFKNFCCSRGPFWGGSCLLLVPASPHVSDFERACGGLSAHGLVL